MNKVVLMGRLTRDPEIRYSQSAEPVAVARYGLAVNRRFKRQGEADVDFFDCVVFGKGAEFSGRYLKKGMMIAVSGRLQNSSWDDQQTGQKRWKTEIIVDEQDFAESKASFESRAQGGATGFGGPQEPQSASPQPSADGFSVIAEAVDDDDLPF